VEDHYRSRLIVSPSSEVQQMSRMGRILFFLLLSAFWILASFISADTGF